MKKLLCIVCALIAGSVLAAKATLDQIAELATIDLATAQRLVNDNMPLFEKLKYNRRYRKMRLEYDKKLADLGIAAFWWDATSYPCLSANERKALGLDKSLAGTVAIAKKYGCNITPYGLIKQADMTPDEAVTVFNEFIQRLDHIGTEWLEVFNSYFADRAGDIAKAHLQKQGTYKDGDEDAYVTAFAEAMATPYYSGVNDWLASVGVQARIIDIRKVWKPDNFKDLPSIIEDGEFPLTDSFNRRLQVILGVDEYNKFVDRYLAAPIKKKATTRARTGEDSRHEQNREMARKLKIKHRRMKEKMKRSKRDALTPKLRKHGHAHRKGVL